jgi:hypothetical protein
MYASLHAEMEEDVSPQTDATANTVLMAHFVNV